MAGKSHLMHLQHRSERWGAWPKNCCAVEHSSKNSHTVEHRSIVKNCYNMDQCSRESDLMCMEHQSQWLGVWPKNCCTVEHLSKNCHTAKHSSKNCHTVEHPKLSQCQLC